MNTSPATFSHPDWLRPVLGHVPRTKMVQAAGYELAVVERRFPVPHYVSLVMPLTPGGAPLATCKSDISSAAQFLEALRKPLLLLAARIDYPATNHLMDGANFSHVLRQWERAALVLDGNYDAWLQENFDHKRRKEMKRLQARLAETGHLVIKELAPDGDPTEFIEDFLVLEASGWKGERHSSVNAVDWQANALRHGARAMHKHGGLRFWKMELDGQPVATLFALVDGGEAHLGKIAHDPKWARFSPGVLVTMIATERLFAEPGIKVADSNAIPGHPMIDRIWRDRAPCTDLLLAGSSVTASEFSALFHWIGIKNAARCAAKKLLHMGTKRREV